MIEDWRIPPGYVHEPDNEKQYEGSHGTSIRRKLLHKHLRSYQYRSIDLQQYNFDTGDAERQQVMASRHVNCRHQVKDRFASYRA